MLKKRGYISFEWIFAAALALLFTVLYVPNMYHEGVHTYEVIMENNKKLVYTELEPGLGVYITGDGTTIHKPDTDEDEIRAPEESGGDITDNKAHVDSIVVDPTSVNLDIGESATITCTLISTIPEEEIDNKGVTWSSDNKNVANVTQDGTITGIAPGAATITVQTHDNNKTAYIYVSVNPILAEDILLNTDYIRISTGATFQVIATVLPADATNQDCVYSIEDDTIASVDATGLVTGLETTRDHYMTYLIVRNGNVEKRVPVEVEGNIIPVDDVILGQDTYNVEVGASVRITSTIRPANATIKDMIYRSLDEYYATVDALGNITGQNPGQTFVEVCAAGGDFYGAEVCRSALVNVTEAQHPLEGLNIRYDSTTITAGQNLTPTITYTPTYTTNKALLWTTSDPTVVSVNDNGVITGHNNGTAVITATSVSNPTISSSVTITADGFINHVTSVEIVDQDLYLQVGQRHTLTTIVEPEDADNKELNFESSDTSILTVDRNGIMTAIRPGEVIVSAISKDTGVTASTIVHVTSIPTTSVAWDIPENEDGTKTLVVKKGTAQYVGVVIEPEDATDKSLIYEVPFPEIADYQNGMVVANDYGETTLTVMGADGTFDILYVTVEKIKPTSITTENPLTMTVNETVTPTFTIEPLDADQEVYLNPSVNTTTVRIVTYQRVCKVNPDTEELECNVTKEIEERTEDVLRINEDGSITALNPGEATILVTAVGDLSVQTELQVIVNPIKATSVNLETPNPMIFTEIGDSDYIMANLSPVDVSNTELIFYTGNDGIISVDEVGLVTTIGYGESDVYVIAADSASYDDEGNLNLDDSVYKVVHVIVDDSGIPATGLETDDELEQTIGIGEQKQLSVRVVPEDATNQTVYWASSDSTIVSVDENTGEITGIKRGTAVISAIHEEGFSIDYIITVRGEDVTKFVVDPSRLILAPGQTASYTIDVEPTTLDVGAYTMTIVDEEGEPTDIISVDENGQIITAIREGVAYVTFDVPDIVINDDYSNYVASIEVVVKDAATIWDGVTEEEPEIVDDTCIIKSVANLAWVSTKSQTNLTCSVLDFQTDIDLLGNDLRTLADAKDGIALTVKGNGHTIMNGTFTSSGNNAGFIGALTGSNSSISDLTFDSVFVSSSATGGINAGLVVGTLNDANLNNVTVRSGQFSALPVGVTNNIGYVAGVINNTNNRGQYIQGLDIVYNDILTVNRTDVLGGLAGIVNIDSRLNLNLIEMNYNSIPEGITTSGGIFGQVNGERSLTMANFSVLDTGGHSLIGDALENTKFNVANYYVAYGELESPLTENVWVDNVGTEFAFNSEYGYYQAEADRNILDENSTVEGVTRKTYEEMYNNEEFVTLLNQPVDYTNWSFVEKDYPVLNDEGMTGISLTNKELVVFTSVSNNIAVDTSYTSIPVGFIGKKVTCSSTNEDIITVNGATCIATAGNTSGEAAIRVTVDDTFYDAIIVTSYAIGEEYGEPAALTPAIEQALVRDYAAGLIEYEKPTEDTWVARLANSYNITYDLVGGTQ